MQRTRSFHWIGRSLDGYPSEQELQADLLQRQRGNRIIFSPNHYSSIGRLFARQH